MTASKANASLVVSLDVWSGLMQIASGPAQAHTNAVGNCAT